MIHGEVLVLTGSHRAAAYSLALGDAILDALRKRGIGGRVISLIELGLPFHDPEDHAQPENSKNEVVRAFARDADRAAGFVWVTPIYHGTVSGVFKNSLDNLNIRIMQQKPVLLAANGGGRFGGTVLDHMRSMAVNLHMRPINTQILVQPSDFKGSVGLSPELVEPAIISRIDRAALEMASILLESCSDR